MKAFPITMENEGYQIDHAGMDLRDYFAAKAMKIFIHKDICWNDGELEFVTNSCYGIADAMMKARAKK